MLRKMFKYHRKWQTYKWHLKHENRKKYLVVETIETVVVALILALIIRRYVVQTSVVPTGSMIPTLMIRDRLFVNKFIYRYKTPIRGDIVVFESPYDDGKDFVKRCIGLPGESVSIRDGYVYIEGKRLVMPGVNIKRDQSNYGPIIVPEYHYFMLGDNRAHSQDSRYWGFVPQDELLGKAFFTFYPLSRMRMLR